MEAVTNVLPDPNLTPWMPSPKPVPVDWLHFINTLSQPEKEASFATQPILQDTAQAVGRMLHSWGLPWHVVVAGYLWSSNEKYLRRAALPETEKVLAHIRQTQIYARYIARENLPPLLTPPYDDPGALLIACAAYFQELKMLQGKSKERPYTGKIQSYIESIGRTLLNIAKRLNIWHFKRDIEDVMERLRSPRRYAELEREHTTIVKKDLSLLEDARQLLAAFYQEATGEPITVMYSACGIAGLKRRLQDAQTSTTAQRKLLTGFDLVIFDVIVPTVRSCYIALGTLSQLGYIQDRVTDQIANPKPNGSSHIALGLVLKSQGPYSTNLRWPEHYTHCCQLQIVTPLMQALNWYGCLYPDYYQLCTVPGNVTGAVQPTVRQLWDSPEGKVFLSIHEGFHSGNARRKPDAPIVVYDRKNQPVALPKGATALDFAFEIDPITADHAVEAFINNRNAPLYRVLEAGDVVEIRTTGEAQANENWLERAITPVARNRIEESLTEQFADRTSYKLLRQKLERYHFMLSVEDLDHELERLLQLHKLGSRQSYLKQLKENGKPPYNHDWAVQEIMQQITDRNEPLPTGGKHHQVPVLDMDLTTNRKFIRQQHLCDLCQPIYPRDTKIMGRLHKRRYELIVHTEHCRRLIDHAVGHQPILLPMTWQLQPPTFVVAFFLIAQDRVGLVNDITRLLRRYQCDLLAIKAEAIVKDGEAHVRLTLETHTYKEASDIWTALARISNISRIDIDAALTPPSVRKHLEEFHAQKFTSPGSDTFELIHEDTAVIQQPRPYLIDNPFDISRPASASMFFGRNEETERLKRELCEEMYGKALILYGPRRSGKSSICTNFIEQHVHPPFWGAFFSLQNFTRHTEEEILSQLAEKVSREFSTQLDRPGPRWEHYREGDIQLRFRRLVQDCLAQVPGTRLILALDEFGGALESHEKDFLHYRFFTYWKELMNEIKQLSIIFALPTSAHRTLTTRDFANAFSFADDLPVTYLDVESAQELLIQPLHERNIGIFPNTIGLALKLTGRNPYYMTLIGQQLVNLLQREPYKERITDEDLNLVVDQITRRGNQNFVFLKKELQDEHELQILEAIVNISSRTHQAGVYLKRIAAELHLSTTIVRRHIDRLCNGLILQEGDSPANPYYTFTIELVHLWLARNRWFFLP
jgi:guanosine-3',5'-bis(diphosphate) 3'-pyrophosphohydrolase